MPKLIETDPPLTPHKLNRLRNAARKSGRRKRALRELNKAVRIQAMTITLQAHRIIQQNKDIKELREEKK